MFHTNSLIVLLIVIFKRVLRRKEQIHYDLEITLSAFTGKIVS